MEDGGVMSKFANETGLFDSTRRNARIEELISKTQRENVNPGHEKETCE